LKLFMVSLYSLIFFKHKIIVNFDHQLIFYKIDIEKNE